MVMQFVPREFLTSRKRHRTILGLIIRILQTRIHAPRRAWSIALAREIVLISSTRSTAILWRGRGCYGSLLNKPRCIRAVHILGTFYAIYIFLFPVNVYKT